MRHARPAVWIAAVLGLAFLAWMVFVGSLAGPELLVGAGCALFCAAASLATWKAMDLTFCFKAADLMEIWRVPGMVLADAVTIVAVLVKDLFGSASAASHFRAAPFEHRAGCRGKERRVLTTIYTSASPNSIVIGVDTAKHLILFHQLSRSPVSTLMKRLGTRA